MNPVILSGANKIITNIESIYKEIKEEWNLVTKEKIELYLSNFLQKNKEVKTILHGNNPRPFYDVYYPLQLQIGSKLYKDYDVKKIFSRRNLFIVTADAGSGKSMLLKHLFNNSIELSYGIPFLIELRYLNEENEKIEDYIFSNIHDYITESDRVMNRLLEKGEFIFFFDGYDEVRKELKPKTVHGIRLLSEKYPKNKFLISSRPYTNIEMLHNFVNIRICPLSEVDIIAFIKKQIRDNELAKKICSSVSDAKKSTISSFLKNPLLLTLYILTYQNSSEIPAKASLFYRRVIDALFIEHDSKTKVGFQRERISNISFDKFEDVMKKFSIVSFFEDKFTFDFEYARSIILKVICDDKTCTFSPENLIDDLKLSFSFWIEDSGIYSFAHRSLQEYFAAMYIRDIDASSKEKIYLKLLEKVRKNENSDMYTILSILEEIDEIYYLKFYLIPLISELKDDIHKDNTNLHLITLLFVAAYKGKEDTNIVINHKGYKYLQLLDRSQMGFKFYKALRIELNKINSLQKLFEKYRNDRGPFMFENINALGIKTINENANLSSKREEILLFIDELLKTARERIQFYDQKKKEILDLI